MAELATPAPPGTRVMPMPDRHERRARRIRWIAWIAIGGPILAFALWALNDNARLFVITLLNGLTLGSLYFIVASGFTLVFGLHARSSRRGIVADAGWGLRGAVACLL